LVDGAGARLSASNDHSPWLLGARDSKASSSSVSLNSTCAVSDKHQQTGLPEVVPGTGPVWRASFRKPHIHNPRSATKTPFCALPLGRGYVRGERQRFSSTARARATHFGNAAWASSIRWARRTPEATGLSHGSADPTIRRQLRQH